MVRDFDSEDRNLQLKMGEFYNFRAGFMADRWSQMGISEDMVLCLSDSDKKECQDYLMEGSDNEVEAI